MKICLVDECERRAESRGACGMHYERYRKTGSFTGIVKKKRKKNLEGCSVGSCAREAITRELCRGHYRKLLRWGSPTGGRQLLTAEEKLARRRASVNKNNMAKRVIALTHYSSTDHPSCVCCGENEIKFLSIDHIDGGGNEHRRTSGITNLAHWLVREGFPAGYQTLCHNCNMAKGFYGSCPHQTVL